MSKFDLVVIGAGPGGYVAAIRAAQLGLKVACIDKGETLGGTCLNVGCIPSKALLQSTEHYHFIQHGAAEHGIKVDSSSIDFNHLMNRKAQVVDGLVNGIATRFKQLGITRFIGKATFVSSKQVKVGNETIDADKFILATGSEPFPLPFLPFDEKQVLSSTGALALKTIPKKMVVIGAGVIGVELASVYRRLGTEIVIVEMMNRVCPTMDDAISKALQRTLEKQGMVFHLSTKVTGATVDKKGVTIQLENKESLQADVVLVAIGRRPFSEGLGLKEIGVEVTSKGLVTVNDQFQTSQSNIYAIGDLIEGPMLAHKASEEGIAVAEIIAGQNPHINYMAIPNVVYTHPEVAAIGLTEKEAKEAGFQLQIGNCFFKANARARCMADTEGLVKVIGDKNSGRLLGLHIIGPFASEMIGEGVIAMEKNATLLDLARASHAHPTLTEAIHEAVLNALGRSIHY